MDQQKQLKAKKYRKEFLTYFPLFFFSILGISAIFWVIEPIMSIFLIVFFNTLTFLALKEIVDIESKGE